MNRREMIIFTGKTIAYSLLFPEFAKASSISPDGDWRVQKEEPEVARRLQVIEAAKKYVTNQGLYIPSNGFFDTIHAPTVHTLAEADNVLLCGGLPDDIELPQDEQQNGVGCWSVPPRDVQGYKTGYFKEHGLTTYEMLLTSSAAGKLNDALLRFSPELLSLVVLHESVHTDRKKHMGQYGDLHIEEPLGMGGELRYGPDFAKQQSALVNPQKLQTLVDVRTRLLLLDSIAATAIKFRPKDTKTILDLWGTRLHQMADEVHPIDPQYEFTIRGRLRKDMTTARLQRDMPYALMLTDVLRAASYCPTMREYAAFCREIPLSPYEEGRKAIEEFLKSKESQQSSTQHEEYIIGLKQAFGIQQGM